MFLLKKLKLGQKMSVGFGLISIILIGIIIFSYFGMRNNRTLFSELNTISREGDTAGRIQANFLLCRLSIKTLLLHQDFSQEKIYNTRYAYVIAFIEQFKATEKDSIHLIKISRIEDQIKQYDTELKHLISYKMAILSGEKSEYVDVIVTKMEDIGDSIANDIEALKLSLLSLENDIDQKYLFNINLTTILMFVFTILGALLAVIIGVSFTRFILKPIKALTHTFNKISQGDTDMTMRLPVESNDELSEMSGYFNIFIEKLGVVFESLDKQNNINSKIAEIDEITRGDQSIEQLSSKIIQYACNITNAGLGAIYVKNEEGDFTLKGTYSANIDEHEINNRAIKTSGVSGCAISEKSIKIIKDLPDNYFKIKTGMGEALPKNIAIIPCIVKDEVVCVLEIASFSEFELDKINIFNSISQVMAIGISTSLSREKINDLYLKTLQQTEELQVQQEELMQSHEELMEQTKELVEKENLLQIQQEELRVTNSELEERNVSLEQQQDEIVTKNKDLEKTKSELIEKANALQISSKYKSEFLANVSHELKTPLNSIMVLSELLANKKDNTPLNTKEIEYAKTIHNSGSELLMLIMDILDLSKVEAGKIELNAENIMISDLVYYFQNSFGEIAQKKGLSFNIKCDNEIKSVFTDDMRLKQIIKNLLSNSFKFTENGKVELEITKINNNNTEMISFKVSDTGIGIESDKLDMIFEAFKQANGTINRKYGGTGLGLSISKQLSYLMGGDLSVESEFGKGSIFCFTIPSDFRLIEQQSQNNKFETTHDSQIMEDSISDGLDNKNILTEKLYENNDTNNSPKNHYSTNIKQQINNIPAQKNVMLVGLYDESLEIAFETDTRIKIVNAISSSMAFSLVENESIDCIILDKHIGDRSGFEFLELLYKSGKLSIPVIIYTDNVVSVEEEEMLLKFSNSIIIKGTKSLERLLSDVEIYLFKSDQAKFNRKIIKDERKIVTEDKLAGTKVLIVDDDVRNIFSITEILENKGMNVVVARNGRDGIDKFIKQQGIDIILMDIMMPIIDGYETIKTIRNLDIGKDVPIIAITAKSMAEDRTKCIKAGANDYTTKPIDVEKLISLMKVWLSK